MQAELPKHCDVAIVGGGPAGLAAAVELRAAGIGSVVVVERESEIGGIPRHCGHFPFGMREFGRVLRGPDYAARLAARARSSGATVLTRATVAAMAPGPTLTLSTPEGLTELSARCVLLATGVRETPRAARLIGGTKPGGVLSTGALQGLVYLEGIRPFRHPVILGTELVSFSALLTCRHLGIRPLAMIEPNDRVTAYAPARVFPALVGTQLLLGTALETIHGDNRVEAVTLRDAAWRDPRAGHRRGDRVRSVLYRKRRCSRRVIFAVDRASGGPVIDQFGRCSDPAYFAAGNLLRAVETAGWCWNEGRETARTIVQHLRGMLPATGATANVRVAGPLKYVVPQIVAEPHASAGATRFQLRAARATNGTLRLAIDGREIWSKPIKALPERRIEVPLDVLRPEAGTRGRIHRHRRLR